MRNHEDRGHGVVVIDGGKEEQDPDCPSGASLDVAKTRAELLAAQGKTVKVVHLSGPDAYEVWRPATPR